MVMLAVLLMRRYSAYIDEGSSASGVKLVLIPRRPNQAQNIASILLSVMIMIILAVTLF